MELELEIKVLEPYINTKELENKIIELGGVLITEEEQINTMIDSIENPLKSKLDGYLRIRETTNLLNNEKSTTLTLKKSVPLKGIRQNIEFNTEIENKDIMLQILGNLGFDKLQVGYKKRKSYSFKGARLDFDTWDKETYPLPYMEIEVTKQEEMKEILELLNIPSESISTKSIHQLRELL